jgi:hypothetical protein
MNNLSHALRRSRKLSVACESSFSLAQIMSVGQEEKLGFSAELEPRLHVVYENLVAKAN